jgi:hypothetical protein
MLAGIARRPLRCPRFCARLRPSAVRVRIRSRSRSARPPKTAIINRPVLVPVSAHGSASERNGALASTICLMIAKRAKVLREAVNPRHSHPVAGSEGGEHSQKLAPVAVRARHLLAVNLGATRAAKLLKLGVERRDKGRCFLHMYPTVLNGSTILRSCARRTAAKTERRLGMGQRG